MHVGCDWSYLKQRVCREDHFHCCPCTARRELRPLGVIRAADCLVGELCETWPNVAVGRRLLRVVPGETCFSANVSKKPYGVCRRPVNELPLQNGIRPHVVPLSPTAGDGKPFSPRKQFAAAGCQMRSTSERDIPKCQRIDVKQGLADHTPVLPYWCFIMGVDGSVAVGQQN